MLLLPKNVLAVNVEIIDFPPLIDNSIFNVEVNISGANDGVNYLRIDLYKEGTTNYFGETYNGIDWYYESDGKKYFPVNIVNSTASASLQAQIGNPSVNKYLGPGEYKLKIRRYTSSGSQSSNDSQNPVNVQISYETPSPEPTQIPTPVPTIIITPSPTTPATHTPTTKPLVTYKPSPTAQSLPSVSNIVSTELPFYDFTNTDSVSPSSTNVPKVLGHSTLNNGFTSFALITLGFLFLGWCTYMIYNNRNAKKTE